MADIALELLHTHGKLVLAEANEAATRLNPIDRVIFDVLKLTGDDVRVEETVSEDGLMWQPIDMRPRGNGTWAIVPGVVCYG